MTIDTLIAFQMKNTQMNNSDDANAWFSREYVTYLGKLENLEAAKVAADKALAVTLEEAKKGAWKWQGRKTTEETGPVVKAREAIKSVEASIVDLKKYYEVTIETISQLRAYEQEREELDAWYAGTGPAPASVKIDLEEERAELLAGCVALKRSPVQEQEEEEDDSWILMSMEEYALSLMPKPVVVVEKEEEVYSRGHPSSLFRKLKKIRAQAAVVI